MQEYEDIDPQRRCCLNCQAFEERTGFCRRHPPKPIPAQFMRNQQQQYYLPVFPKIALPHIDWCEDGIFICDDDEKTQD